jgi:hypothetical protein
VEHRLNTFLELKMENERLQKRVTDLKALQSSEASIYSAPSISNTGPSLQMPMVIPPGPYPGYQVPSEVPQDINSSPIRTNFESGIGITPYGGIHQEMGSSRAGEEDMEDDGTRKKKVGVVIVSLQFITTYHLQHKKSHPSEQYVCVTCGRTDSPEWRKVVSTLRYSAFSSALTRDHLARKLFATHVASGGPNRCGT